MYHEQLRDESVFDVCRVPGAASDRRMRAPMLALVESDSRYIVIAETRSGDDAVTLGGELKPALVLLDLLIPTVTARLDAVRLLAHGNARPISSSTRRRPCAMQCSPLAQQLSWHSATTLTPCWR